MRGEFFFLVALDLFLPCVVPEYCLVYIVGIRALYSILPGAGAEPADPRGHQDEKDEGDVPPTTRIREASTHLPTEPIYI